MINLGELTQSSGWKSFMAKLYGIGASVVIVGALFKIQHWPGAGPMLTVGLLTEAIIFFFSAFEPLHEELDWTLVYPELAGMTDPDEIESFRATALSGRGNVSTEKIEEVLAKAGASDETFSKLGEGFSKLSSTITNISDISEATVATKEYFSNMKNAATTVNSLTDAFAQSTQGLHESVGNLSQSYQKTADVIARSGHDVAENVAKTGSILAQSYEGFAESLKSEFNTISQGSKNYGDHLGSLNKNLNSLNELYELQLNDTKEQMKGAKEFYGSMGKLMSDLKNSVDETQKYKDEVSKLNQSLSALNTIYGNMLSAMNFSGSTKS
jgi:gliding motility-associated protein GldL